MVSVYCKPNQLNKLNQHHFYTQYFADCKIKVDYVVGDRVDTDINFAKKINAKSILVTSGVSNFLSEDTADIKLNSFSEIIPFII